MDPLQNWYTLLDVITTADEDTCLKLLAREKKGAKRLTLLLRIHSRLNKVRAHREREELTRLAQ